MEPEANDTVTITSVSLHPVQRDGYLQVWVGNNVPEQLAEHWTDRTLTARQLDAVGAWLEDGQWVLNYMGRNYILQTGPRPVAEAVVYNEPRPFPVRAEE